jgi:hypothetical protein
MPKRGLSFSLRIFAAKQVAVKLKISLDLDTGFLMLINMNYNKRLVFKMKLLIVSELP